MLGVTDGGVLGYSAGARIRSSAENLDQIPHLILPVLLAADRLEDPVTDEGPESLADAMG
jgi:hypothetical protein